ncbi:MAG: outer membrane protein assembly factor BamC [Proteobacteria bacterium]|nr:outer membrane protein assembly factor BamC [Pseudomonadota bacterium]
MTLNHFRLLLGTPLLLLALYGCSSTQEFERATPDWNSTASLEVPPDLTAPKENASTGQFSAAAQDATSAELDQYAQFQKHQKAADFQDFLQWRDAHSMELDLSLEAFREARDDAIAIALKEKGVLTITTQDGQRILLINDTPQNSWERLNSAVVNTGLQVISRRANKGYLQVRYDTQGADEGGWQRWIPLLSDPIIYRVALEQTRNGGMVSIKDDDGAAVNTDLANILIDHLGVQLRTFAGESEQAALATQNQPGLVLEKATTGYLTLVIPGTPGDVWTRLDRQLQDIGFSLANRDKVSLRFVVRYDDPKYRQKRSFIQGLAFWKKGTSTSAQNIHLALTPAKDSTRVDALDDAGQSLASGDQVLRMIFDSLKTTGAP